MRALFLGFSAAGLALLSGVAAEVTAQTKAKTPLCPTLKRIVTAAGETPIWKTVSRGSTATAVPVGFSKCSMSNFSSESQYGCDAKLTKSTVAPRYAQLLTELTTCLGTKPVRSGDNISTYNTFKTQNPAVEVSAALIQQAGNPDPKMGVPDNYGIGLSVVQRF